MVPTKQSRQDDSSTLNAARRRPLRHKCSSGRDRPVNRNRIAPTNDGCLGFDRLRASKHATLNAAERRRVLTLLGKGRQRAVSKFAPARTRFPGRAIAAIRRCLQPGDRPANARAVEAKIEFRPGQSVELDDLRQRRSRSQKCVQAHARFSRVALMRRVAAELVVGVALHMRDAPSGTEEDRLASGELRGIRFLRS